MNRRKKVGLILSGIGETLYLAEAVMYIGFSRPLSIWPFSILFIGAISVVGTIAGKDDIKFGGALILISTPFSIIYTLILYDIFILNEVIEVVRYNIFPDLILFVLYPIPFPHSVFLIIGLYLCLTSFDE